MVLLQRHLTQADWEECERRSFAKPATPAEVSFAVPWVCLDLPATPGSTRSAPRAAGSRWCGCSPAAGSPARQRQAFGS